MSSNTNEQDKVPHYTNARSPPGKGILQKPHNFEAHETPEHKIKWDENKLKVNEKQQEQVLMKVDEPNTPYIRYDPVTDQVTNWEDLPENVRTTANEEPEEFSLDGSGSSSNSGGKISFGGTVKKQGDEWDKADEREKQDKEEAARKRHQEFEKKRAQHYYHAGDVLHENLDDDDDDKN